MSKRDAYRANTSRMAGALRGIGWTASVEYLAGGCWGITVQPGDGPDLLVSMDPDVNGRPWVVGLDCQMHPLHGYDEGTRYVPWSSWETLVPAVSVALHTLRTLPQCPCGEHLACLECDAPLPIGADPEYAVCTASGYAGAHDAGTAHVERAHPAPSCSCRAEGRTRCAFVACEGRTP